MNHIKKSIEERFWENVCICTYDRGCWLWIAGTSLNGYGCFHARRSHPEYAHRVAWILNHGPIPHGLCVLHKCDVRACVRPDHLFLGTRRDNSHDARAKGRLGPQCDTFRKMWANRPRELAEDWQYNVKLNAEAVREIRSTYQFRKITLSHFAKKFGVSYQTIHEVVTFQTWRHVK